MKPKCAITRTIKSEQNTTKAIKSGVQKIVSLIPGLSRLRLGRAQGRDMSEYQAHDRKAPFYIIPHHSIVPGMELLHLGSGLDTNTGLGFASCCISISATPLMQ